MKKIQVIFLVIIFSIVLIPVSRFNFSGKTSKQEKRTLASFPSFLTEENKINFSFSKEIDTYISDRIGLKYKYVYLKEKINGIFQMENKFLKKVIYGKGYWLFYNNVNDGDELSFYNKTNLFTDDQIAQYSEKIYAVQKWCEANRIKFIFFIAPNKQEIYEEYHPLKRPVGETWTEQIFSRLKNDGINVIYPKLRLLNAKANEDFPLYYERDTHWNKKGAYYGSLEIVEMLKDFFPNSDFPNIEYSFSPKKIPGGDLPPMIGINQGQMTDYDFVATVNHEEISLYEYVQNNAHDGVITKGNENFPKAVIFRDSFTTALEPFISPYFSYAEYNWKRISENDKAYILEQKPDVLIFEVVERGAPSFLYSEFLP